MLLRYATRRLLLAVPLLLGISVLSFGLLQLTPGNPVMVVQGERERLIPFLLERFVDSVDLDAGEIVVDWDADF